MPVRNDVLQNSVDAEALRRAGEAEEELPITNPQSIHVRSKIQVLSFQLQGYVELRNITFGYSLEVYYALTTTLEQFRAVAKANLKNDNDFIIVNYNCSAIGQTGGGHISPIAAYHEKTDKFLIQDVSSYKYPPIWVRATMLWNAMNTGDAISGKTRGYLIVKK